MARSIYVTMYLSCVTVARSCNYVFMHNHKYFTCTIQVRGTLLLLLLQLLNLKLALKIASYEQ